MSQNASPPIEVFCSYAPIDEPWYLELEKHLSLLRRQGIITTWHRRNIAPGTDWTKAIDTHLGSASVVLLLISPDFFASDYCYGVELQGAMERHDAGEARVIPVLLRPVDLTGAPFKRLAPLPSNEKPITTWPDRDQAWTDVVAGIRRAIEELPRLSVSTPRTALPSVWNIPYPRNPVFTGREEVLERLARSRRSGQTMALSQPQAISGLGGIGKTMLSVEYAYQYRSDYQAVLWTLAESREALISGFVAIAGLLNLPEKDTQEQMIVVNAVKVWLQKRTGWLLILDNADDLKIIPEFLPPTYGGHVLLTTRAQAMGRLAQRIEVETLTPDVGALFLLRRAELLALDASLEQASQADQEIALSITEELGGLPLALDQAGAYIEETGCSLVDYQQLYQHRRAELLKERRGMVADHPESVATTVSIAFQRVERNNPAATELLRFCAFLAPDAIPEEIITQGAKHLGPILGPVAADAFLLNQAIEVLRASSLVQRDPGRKMLSMHRLVQAVLRDATGAEETEIWAERTVQAVSTVLAHTRRVRLQWEHYLAHAQHCVELIEQYNITSLEAADLLSQIGYYLQEHARYLEVEPLFQWALTIYEQQLGPDHLRTANGLYNLAWLYYQQSEYAQAESLFQQALAIYEQQLGPDHLCMGPMLNILASIYRKQGKYADAESLSQQALTIYGQSLNPDQSPTIGSFHDLAWLYHKQGKYDQAELLYQQTLALTEETYGADHIRITSVLKNLAMLYGAQGRYVEAEPLYQRVLAIYEQELGTDHPHVANCLSYLASLYREQGKYDQAELTTQQAITIYEQWLETDRPHTVTDLHDLAWLYHKQGKYDQAESWYQRVLTIGKEQLGPGHPHTLSVRRNYASLLRTLGREADAVQLEAPLSIPSSDHDT